MLITYKNLKINFFYSVIYDDFDAFGLSRLSIGKEDMIKLIHYSDCLDNNNNYEIGDLNLWYDEDAIEDMPDTFTTENTDLQVLLFSWILDSEYDITIEYHSSNPAWLLHDICHGIHDVSGNILTVTQRGEELVIFRSIELAAELGLLLCFNAELFNSFDKEFNIRWRVNFPVKDAIELLNKLINKL